MSDQPKQVSRDDDALNAGELAAPRRWQQLDPLLPAMLPADPAGHQVTRPGGCGSCRHWAGVPDSLDLTWGAARRFEVTPRIDGPDVAASLDQLVQSWREHVNAQPGSDDPDSAAVITWPSRDTGGVRTLLRRGFAPLAVIAARRHGGVVAAGLQPPGGNEAQREGLSIRPADAGDLDALVRLGLEVIRFDAQVSAVTERPGTAKALRGELSGLLAAPQPWIWLAERHGTAIGMLAAEPPAAAGWIAPLVSTAPVAYLLLMGVAAGQRGSGVGAALTAAFHRAADTDGVGVTLLHYAQVNPLSAPFWSQQGYRPLWTVWEAAPARAMR
jgi:GNAT superfamily N-acetyltransferase